MTYAARPNPIGEDTGELRIRRVAEAVVHAQTAGQPDVEHTRHRRALCWWIGTITSQALLSLICIVTIMSRGENDVAATYLRAGWIIGITNSTILGIGLALWLKIRSEHERHRDVIRAHGDLIAGLSRRLDELAALSQAQHQQLRDQADTRWAEVAKRSDVSAMAKAVAQRTREDIMRNVKFLGEAFANAIENLAGRLREVERERIPVPSQNGNGGEQHASANGTRADDPLGAELRGYLLSKYEQDQARGSDDDPCSPVA
jgi:hypothetical protein